MLDKEFKYYLKHQDEFVNKYDGKFIVLKGTKVLGAYDTQLDAYLESAKDNEVGTFLIQLVSPGEESYTVKLHSRAF